MSVLILMSTYNGEKYIKNQLDSLLSQNCPQLKILIRDDGSTDNTCSILEYYSNKFMNITWYKGKNIGPCKSFFDLINKADSENNYYAFSDQDDVWLPDKISRAILILKKYSINEPALYCSDKIIVDQQLSPCDTSIKQLVKKVSFGNALVQNMCTGCTAVMNHKLFELIKYHIPEYTIMHDWWFYLTASCFGNVYYDSESLILYRQHGNNTFGTLLSRKALLEYRIKQLFNQRGEIYKQVEEFKKIFFDSVETQSLNDFTQVSLNKNQELVNELLNSKKLLKYRLRLMFEPQIYRQKTLDNLILKLIILLGKL